MYATWQQCDKDPKTRRKARYFLQRATAFCAAAFVALSAFAVAAVELPSGGYVWVLGVNGTLSARHPGTLKTAAQAPDAGAIALSGNRKRLFAMESAVGRVF